MLGSSARDIMTRNVITVRRGSSIDETLRLMAEYHVSGLPVVDAEGCLEGIITESDLLLKDQSKVSLPSKPLRGHWPISDEDVEEKYRKGRAILVEDAMTANVITFTEDSAVSDIARIMIEHRINRVPIVYDRKVVGIVSRSDIVKALAETVTPIKMTHDAGEIQNVIELTDI